MSAISLVVKVVRGSDVTPRLGGRNNVMYREEQEPCGCWARSYRGTNSNDNHRGVQGPGASGILLFPGNTRIVSESECHPDVGPGYVQYHRLISDTRLDVKLRQLLQRLAAGRTRESGVMHVLGVALFREDPARRVLGSGLPAAD